MVGFLVGSLLDCSHNMDSTNLLQYTNRACCSLPSSIVTAKTLVISYRIVWENEMDDKNTAKTTM